MKNVLLTGMLSLVALTVLAVPAKRGVWKTIKLADGTQLKAQLHGDEFRSWWQTVDGQRYVQSDSVYVIETEARLQAASQRRAAVHQHRAALAARRAPSKAASPYLGQKTGLILLADFSDVKFQSRNTASFYQKVANTEGFTDEQGYRGSVADYFRDQSEGQFLLNFDVVGPVTLSKKRDYYGENDANGNETHAREFVREAVTLAMSKVTDWSKYDWDDDGYVDQVMIIYAGEGEATGGPKSSIWPHEWQLATPLSVGNQLVVSTYAVANEVIAGEDNRGKTVYWNEGIGGICHEFSHCLGLMDMYDTSDEGSNYGMSYWSLMDQGSYNGDGFCPAGYTSFERYSIGWITPTELTEETSVTGMRALQNATDIYRITNPANENEYYLLENRQQTKWDAELPSSGMLVLHVDYDENIWWYNRVNSYYSDFPSNDHQRCTMFHADGKENYAALYEKLVEAYNNYYASKTQADMNYWSEEYYRISDEIDQDIANDVYPQPANNQLTNTSTPRAFLYHNNTDGRKLMNISITDIRQNADGTIAFHFAPDHSGSGVEGDNTDYGEGVPEPSDDDDMEGTLFYESFNECVGRGGNDALWNGSGVANGTFLPDNNGWTTSPASLAYGAYQCAKFGKSSSLNFTVSTPSITLDGSATLTFKAGAWDGQKDGTTLALTVTGGTVSPSSFTLKKGEWSNYTATVTGTGSIVVGFKQVLGRFFLDEVRLKAPNGDTAIREVSLLPALAGARIYTLDGRYAGTDLQPLPHGVYIVGGKKVVK